MSSIAAESLESRAIHAILDGLSRTESLRESYVLKGGFALHAAYGSPRRSFDLDLNAAAPSANQINDESNRRLLHICRDLNEGLRKVCMPETFVRLYTTNERLSNELPVLLGEVAYVTNDGASGHIKMQVMLSEIICESTWRELRGIPVLVASLEDIIAEKLKAIIQQVTRNSIRSIDVFDVWYFTTSNRHQLDPAKTTHYLLEKSKQWNLPPLTKSQFRDEAVMAISESAFEAIGNQLAGTDLPPFSEAYGALLRFVDRLDLPD